MHPMGTTLGVLLKFISLSVYLVLSHFLLLKINALLSYIHHVGLFFARGGKV